MARNDQSLSTLCGCRQNFVPSRRKSRAAFLDTLGVFAEFETTIRSERQMEGIKRAKAEGAFKGRKPSIDRAKVARLKAEGLGATAIAMKLGCQRTSVYRVLKEMA
ncbi:MAG: helix-turn-helix domain-containing protein [Rhodomicrobium sp.]